MADFRFNEDFANNWKSGQIVTCEEKEDGSKYGLSTGAKRGFCTREFYEFDSVEEIETLMLGLADMLNKIRLEHNGKLPRW